MLDVAGLVKKICPKTSAVSGEVICSDTGKAPEKTRISIFDANSPTTLVKEVDISEGIYNINLAPGEYCIYYATDGYITIVSDNVKVLNNSVYINDVVLSPTEKPITNGKLYWRYTPAGIGYDDNVVAYAQPNENYDYIRRRYMSRRGCGLSNVESATYDLILSELTEITWEQYLREKEEQDIFWGMVKLIDIPLYNISDGSQSNYYLRFSYMLHEGHYSSSSPWYYSIQTAIELYDGNQMLKNWSSVYLDPPFKLNDADRNQNYRYFVYAGSGKLWANSDATSELDNNIYMGEVLYCEDSQTSNIYIGNSYDVINYQWLMDTYGVKLDDSLYKGNNDNPNYPIK